MALILLSLGADNAGAGEPVSIIEDGLHLGQGPVPVQRRLGWGIEDEDGVPFF